MCSEIQELFYGEKPFDIRTLNNNYKCYVERMDRAHENDLYATLLAMQFYPATGDHVGFFVNDSCWKSATEIIDFGCGPAHLIRLLNRYFPEKSYTGIDSSAEFLEYAREKASGINNCKFICHDVYDFKQGTYDYATARMLIQHLEHQDRFLKNTAGILKPGGILHIMDAADELWYELPIVPTQTELRKKLSGYEGKHHKSRNVLEVVTKAVKGSGFEIKEAKKLFFPFVSEEEKSFYVRYHFLLPMAIKKILKIEFDMHKVTKDLICWFNKKNAYAQWGLSRIILRKI